MTARETAALVGQVTRLTAEVERLRNAAVALEMIGELLTAAWRAVYAQAHRAMRPAPLGAQPRSSGGRSWAALRVVSDGEPGSAA